MLLQLTQSTLKGRFQKVKTLDYNTLTLHFKKLILLV